MVLGIAASEPTPARRAAGREATVLEGERAAAGEADDRRATDGDVTAGRDEAVAGELLYGSVDGEALDDAIEVELRSRIAEDERAGDANVAPASRNCGGRWTLLVGELGKVAVVACGFDRRTECRIDEAVGPPGRGRTLTGRSTEVITRRTSSRSTTPGANNTSAPAS